jgi:hypothetical protein
MTHRDPGTSLGAGTAALLVLGVAVDAAVAAALLLGTPLPPPLEGGIAAGLHGIAVLFLAIPSGRRPSRRWLGIAAALTVPLLGAAVAVATYATPGQGAMRLRRHVLARPRRPPTPSAWRRLGGALSVCDALVAGDAERRRAALASLARRGDSEAIAVLRRAAGGRDPDLALSAAIVLDEIGERAERRLRAPVALEDRHAAI